MKMKCAFFCVVVCLISGCSDATYEDCILANIDKAKTSHSASLIHRACGEKHKKKPVKAAFDTSDLGDDWELVKEAGALDQIDQ